MTDKLRKSPPTWSDPDDAPDWTAEQIARAEIADGDKIIRPATGTLTRPRGRPKTGNAKVLVSLRIEPGVLERYRALGPGWQKRVNEVLKAASEGIPSPSGEAAERPAERKARKSARRLSAAEKSATSLELPTAKARLAAKKRRAKRALAKAETKALRA